MHYYWLIILHCFLLFTCCYFEPAVSICLTGQVKSLKKDLKGLTDAFYLGIAQIERSSLLVLIHSCNRHAIRADVNKPSDANVYCVLCHNTAFVFVTYDPQITHGKQIGNTVEKKLEKTRYTERMVWLIAKSLTIFLLSVVECQRSWHAKFHDLVHEIIKGNIIKWCIISLHIFGKEVISYYLIEQNVLEKQIAFFHGRTVKGAESDISTRKPRSIFKTLGLGMDH